MVGPSTDTNCMAQLVEQFTAILAVLAASFLGPGLAIGFLLLRKRRQRAERCSPINRDLLRSPGHSLRVGEIKSDNFVPINLSICRGSVQKLGVCFTPEAFNRPTSSSKLPFPPRLLP